MSAYLLLNPTVPTSIADELEAFLHVLIYGCVRRLRSNLPTIHAFIEDYFAGSSYDPLYEQASCPSAKRESVVSGRILKMTTRPIVFATPDGKVSQKHPLNALISVLLSVFHSRYVVSEWEDESKMFPVRSFGGQSNHPEVWDNVRTGYPEAFRGTSKRAKIQPRQIKPLAPEILADVAALEDHAMILDIFYSYARADNWPADDVVPDRQDEPLGGDPPWEAPVAGVAIKRQDSPIPQAEEAEEPEDVPIPHAEVNMVEDSDQATARKTGRDEIEVSPERPRKRRRMDPVVQEADANILRQAMASEVPTRRVTRSRSAAIAAAAPVPAPITQPRPRIQAAATSAPSPRITRSRRGKLPTGNTTGGRADASASSSEPKTRRGGRSRTAVRTSAAPSRPTRNTRGGAEQSTENSGVGRRTRRK